MRTCPTGDGTSSSPVWTSSCPIRPRWTCTTRSPENSQNRCLPAASAPTSREPSTRAAAVPLHLVGAMRLAVAGAADDDAEAAGLGRDRHRRAEAEDGVVVEGVVLMGPVVDGLVAVVGEPGHQVGLEVETGMVATEV